MASIPTIAIGCGVLFSDGFFWLDFLSPFFPVSKTMCALVPPKPNALTAALRSDFLWGHSMVCWTIWFGDIPAFLELIGSTTPTVAGIFPCCSDKMTFVMPPIPAAVSMWPRFDFTEPIRGLVFFSSAVPSAAKNCSIESSSTLSPSGVPVAWHSM